MNTHTGCLLCVVALSITSAFGQQAGAPVPPRRAAAPPPATMTIIDPATGLPTTDSPGLACFDLDFPGGTPKELVAAIQKAMRRPLNAIVPDEFNDVSLPALKLKGVNVAQLFQALEAASRKNEAFVTGTPRGGGGGRGGGGFAGGPQSYSITTTSYGFRTEGKLTDDSIWYFVVNKPALPPAEFLPLADPPNPPKVCRFYSLAPYLERGLSVDDITTAIGTGWNILDNPPKPEISFHKETKLLIAVGEPSKLEIIDDVLRALAPRPASPSEDVANRIRELRSRTPVPAPPVPPVAAPPAQPVEIPTPVVPLPVRPVEKPQQ